MNRLIDQEAIDNRDGATRGLVTVGIWAYLLLSGISLVHLAVRTPTSIIAPWNWLDLAYGWWVAISFVLLQVGIGHRLLSWMERDTAVAVGIPRWLIAFTVGFWVSVVVFMTLAALGAFHLVTICGYLVIAIACVTWPLRNSWAALRQHLFSSSFRGLFSGLILAGVILLVLLPLVIRSLLPNSDWDGASTHLPLAAWLQAHGLSPVPSALSNMVIPGTVHLVYAAFLALGAEQAIIPLNLLISLMTCFAASSIAERFWGKSAGWWTLGVCLSINILLELGLDPRIDGFLAFFCTMGALGIMAWLLESRQPEALVVSGMALGNALGSKYTAVIPIFLWGLPVLWTLIRERKTWTGKRSLGVIAAVICLLVPSGFWYASNYVSLGDPLYPRLKGEMLRLHDGTSVPEGKTVRSLVIRAKNAGAVPLVPGPTFVTRPPYEPPKTLFNPVSVFTHPDRHTRKPGHTVSPLLLLFLLLPLFHRDRRSWMLCWMGVSVFVVIGSRTHLLRYGLLVYPLLAVGSGVVLASFKSRGWRVIGLAALVAALGWNLWLEWKMLPDLKPMAWLRGEEDRLGWLSLVGYNSRTEMPRAIRDIREFYEEEEISREGKVLMIGEAKGRLLGMETIPDISRTGRPWLARLARNESNIDAVHTDLWNEGVRYVLVNLNYFQWVRENLVVDIDELLFSLHSIEQFNLARGEVLPLQDENMVFVRIRPPQALRE